MALAAGFWCFSVGCPVKSLPLPTKTELLGIRSSSFNNPMMSAKKHIVQIAAFCYLLSAADDLRDGLCER